MLRRLIHENSQICGLRVDGSDCADRVMVGMTRSTGSRTESGSLTAGDAICLIAGHAYSMSFRAQNSIQEQGEYIRHIERRLPCGRGGSLGMARRCTFRLAVGLLLQ